MVKLDTWIAANEMEKVGDKAKLNIRGLIFSQKLSRWVQKVGKLLEASWAADFVFVQRSKVSFRTNKRQELCWLATKPTQHGDPISNLWVGLIIKRRGCFFFKFNHLCVEERVDDLASASIVWIRFAKKTPGIFFIHFYVLNWEDKNWRLLLKLGNPSRISKHFENSETRNVLVHSLFSRFTWSWWNQICCPEVSSAHEDGWCNKSGSDQLMLAGLKKAWPAVFVCIKAGARCWSASIDRNKSTEERQLRLFFTRNLRTIQIISTMKTNLFSSEKKNVLSELHSFSFLNTVSSTKKWLVSLTHGIKN